MSDADQRGAGAADPPGAADTGEAAIGESRAAPSIRVIRAADAPWHDVQTVFGTRGDPSACWCQWFKMSRSQFTQTDAAARQAALRTQTGHDSSQTPNARHGSRQTPGPSSSQTPDAGRGSDPTQLPGPGLIAYLGHEPVGWVAVEPRPAYPQLRRSRIARGSAELFDDDGVWSVTCFVVRVGHRRQGVASALLDAAVEHARVGGARVVEAYPIDTAERTASSADLYHGALAQFERAGFGVVSRPSPGRAVVSRTV